MNKIKQETIKKLGWDKPKYGWSKEKKILSDALLEVEKQTRKECMKEYKEMLEDEKIIEEAFKEAKKLEKHFI